jgi:biopolymer transport protein ExbB
METISFLELFKMGGFFMYPLLFFSIATVTIVLDRAIYLIYYNLKLDDLKAKVLKYMLMDAWDEAEAFLEENRRRRMGARILLVLVKGLPFWGNNRNFSEERLEKTVEAEAMDCINSLENGFNFLTVLGSIAPLTGFLGTVSGMIGAFRSISEAQDVNAQIVANGIYEALITTVFGLIIAIIAMAFHALFTHIVDRFAANVEKTCTDLFAQLLPREELPRKPEVRI